MRRGLPLCPGGKWTLGDVQGEDKMSRKLIDENEGFPLSVNTFAGGERGECVQITELGGQEGYVTMEREEAIRFFRMALEQLEDQVKKDKENPPWWQIINK